MITRKISEIQIGDRHRQEMGDLAGLAASIAAQGLLQPIGITAEDELVFGYRRLRAVVDILKWTEIEVRIVNVTSIIAGEYAENEMRKDFTVSERVAILETIKRYAHGANRFTKDRAEDIPIYNRDEAVRLAGLGNTTTAREATIIVKDGIPELVAAVDAGKIAVEPGFCIASEPPERQAEIVALPAPERRAAIRDIRRGSKHQPRQQRKSRAVPTRPPPMRDLTPEERGMPPAEMLGQQAPGEPPGVTLALAHTQKHGRTQLWSPSETEIIKLRGGFSEFTARLIRLAADDLPDPTELDHLDPNARARIRRLVGKHLGRAQARLDAWETLLLAGVHIGKAG